MEPQPPSKPYAQTRTRTLPTESWKHKAEEGERPLTASIAYVLAAHKCLSQEPESGNDPNTHP